MTGKAIVLQGNALSLPLADESVDLIVTSPPYFALRSYRDGARRSDRLALPEQRQLQGQVPDPGGQVHRGGPERSWASTG